MYTFDAATGGLRSNFCKSRLHTGEVLSTRGGTDMGIFIPTRSHSWLRNQAITIAFQEFPVKSTTCPGELRSPECLRGVFFFFRARTRAQLRLVPARVPSTNNVFLDASTGKAMFISFPPCQFLLCTLLIACN